MSDTNQLPLTRPVFDEQEVRLLSQTLASGWVTQGPMVRRFEQLVADRHKVSRALAVTSCTAALHLAAVALGLGPGDEVVVPAFTWVTSAHAAEFVGAQAVFCDIDLNTFNMNPAALERSITERTKAIVVVHLFGLAAPMDEILKICRAKGIAVIEDAACAIGTHYDGVPVGGLGDVGCFSFHPRKIVTTGEGGMATTNDLVLAERIASMRNHGATPNKQWGPDSALKPYYMAKFDRLGFNLRLSDIQAAVGVAQMGKLDAMLAERRRRALRYDELLESIGEVIGPNVPAKCGHTYQSYVVRLGGTDFNGRNSVMEAMAAEGIQTRPGTHAVHRLGYYRDKYGLRPEDFPLSSLAEDLTIALPLYPGMTDEDQQRVIESLKTALTKR